MYAHYREEQERIGRVHDVLNLLIFGFFCVLVMFEDIVFLIFPNKKECLTIFPLLMLAVVFRSEERRAGKECRSRWSP